MNMTSIKDIDGDVVHFEPQTWAGFNVSTNHCLRSFQNHQGPAVALAVLDACRYGKSAVALQLRDLARDLALNAIPGSLKEAREAADDVVDATVLEDPADAAARALATLVDASNGLPVVPEVARAMDALTEYAARVQAEAEATADREKLEAEALEHEAEALYLAGCECLAASASGHTTVAWNDLSGRTQDAHLSVARAARNIHGVSK